MSPTACWNGVSGESKGSRLYDKENLLWQFTVAIKSDPVGSHITQLAHDNAKKASCKFKRYRIDAWEEFEFQGSATPTLTWLGIGFSVGSWDWSLYKHKKSFYQSVEVEVEACCCGTIPMAESVTSQVVGFPGDSAK